MTPDQVVHGKIDTAEIAATVSQMTDAELVSFMEGVAVALFTDKPEPVTAYKGLLAFWAALPPAKGQEFYLALGKAAKPGAPASDVNKANVQYMLKLTVRLMEEPTWHELNERIVASQATAAS